MHPHSLSSIDHIELYVFNAFQAANFYRIAFGFDVVAYAGPETGLKDKISYLLRQGSINLIISSSIKKDSSILKHVIDHDESIKDIAFKVNNASRIYEEVMKKGAKSLLEPTIIDDGKTRIMKATIATFGNTVHSFIERQNSSSYELPFYSFLNYSPNTQLVGLESVDHIAIAIDTGNIERWVNFYQETLGFVTSSSEDIYTGASGMKSVVVTDISKTIKFVLVEGVSGEKKSQIENFVSHHGCPGVQHLAFSSKNIINTAALLQKQGIKFLEIPESYYDGIPPTLKAMLQDKLDAIQRSSILVDLEENGYLMQMFTRPLQNRPTFFIEIIQRENSTGFGSNNIRALYEAVEKDQRRAKV
ncbi:MAG: 4-hydroxyphenylpyruvate dioxygenase [Proteobacteria bacterium]|nr:4-hydroxyphenylpyruvate dioxygenase [Pseudomonadota bacterium]